CIQVDDPLRVVPHPSGYIQAVAWPSGDIILASGGVSPICLDSDGDGVRDVDDLCPSVNAAPYDMDGDGCIDLTADNRRLEYWLRPDFPIEYVISQSGCPGIGDGSEFTEVQNGMSTWNAVAGSDAEYTFSGQVVQNDARALDQINLVTFNDPDFAFPPGVLAVGIATSFTEPTFYNGSPFREGQLYDFDMIFNSSIGFSTVSAGSGPRILGVAVHEAGHGLGISHSIVETSTMAYVLHPGAATLATEDSLTVFMHYGGPAEIAVASQLGGTIIDGYTGQPIVAGIVFAVDAADGDTSGCAITRDDGSFIFVGLPDGGYYVACHPIDSTSTINYIRPLNINPLVASIPLVDFVPEWWDAAESLSDNASDRDLIPVIAGMQVLDKHIVTNVDMTPPTVTTVTPADEEIAVPIGSAILIKFSESIDLNSTSGSITLEDTTAHNSLSLGGFASQDDSLLTILPGGNL
ncbi:MAG: Ig-like domain-containing protein, partial [Candidatus Krumholzibacteria bacterium]|nr:Ig-like domain-containing protein [Candidatus Krumholzibacteria bacterium]